MEVSEDVWAYMQTRLGYTDEEMKKFKENPRNVEVVSKAPALMNKTIVVEVVDAHGCGNQHKVGDKFYFDGAGRLLTSLCPRGMCIYALCVLPRLINTATELMYAGIDPNEMRFKRIGCGDIGLNCDGWGHIVMEIRVEDRKKR